MKDIDEEIMAKALLGDYPKPILIEDLGMMFATENSKKKVRYGLYKCGFCGNNFRTQISRVKGGYTKSCGCYQKRRAKESNKTHGLKTTRLYKTWWNIKSRTLNSKDKDYPNYGGRGITLWDEWKNDFMSFYTWAMSNGYSDELSIDRIDNNGNYEPNNCRWTTKTIQTRNQRIPKNNTSGYRGVHFDKKLGKYIAKISINKKRIQLGYFTSPEEGAIAYNNYIIENNLEGFVLNEIPEDYQQKI